MIHPFLGELSSHLIPGCFASWTFFVFQAEAIPQGAMEQRQQQQLQQQQPGQHLFTVIDDGKDKMEKIILVGRVEKYKQSSLNSAIL